MVSFTSGTTFNAGQGDGLGGAAIVTGMDTGVVMSSLRAAP